MGKERLGEVMTQPQLVENHPDGSPETSVASAVIPWNRDDPKALYLGYRSSGLSIRESLQMLGKAKSTLSLWRKDPEFVNLEGRIPEFRRELAKEYIEIEFFRNFRFILEKDHQVIKRALKATKDDPLSRQDQEYLIKLRAQYSPSQIQILEAIVQKGEDGINFAQFIASNPDIIQMSRTDTVTMKTKEEDD